MKFSCERCGKKYATAEEPAAGRVYKIKCKACGNLIVVKAGAGAPSGSSVSVDERPPVAEAPPALELHPASTPDADLGLARATSAELPPLAAPPADPFADAAPPAGADGAGDVMPIQRLGDATTELSMSGLGAEATRTPTPGPALTPTPAPAPATKDGYIDLFGDGGEGGDDAGAAAKPPDDPFLAAARSSLPDGYGADGAPPLADAFAPVSPEPPARTPTPVPARPAPRHAIPELVSPATRAAQRKSSAVPLALIGAGVAVLAGILVFVLVRGGPKPAAQPHVVAPVAAAPVERASAPVAPVAPPAPAVAAAEPPKATEPPAPAAAEPAPAPEPAPEAKPEPARHEKVVRRERTERKRTERRTEPKPERRPEPKPQVRTASAPLVREGKPEIELPAADAVDEATVNKVIASNRRAFEKCIVEAKASTDVTLDGRKVALRLTVNPNGLVTYPTLDDVTLNATNLGACLKTAARLMVFPQFKGDPFHAEVPLVLKP